MSNINNLHCQFNRQRNNCEWVWEVSVKQCFTYLKWHPPFPYQPIANKKKSFRENNKSELKEGQKMTHNLYFKEHERPVFREIQGKKDRIWEQCGDQHGWRYKRHRRNFTRIRTGMLPWFGKIPEMLPGVIRIEGKWKTWTEKKIRLRQTSTSISNPSSPTTSSSSSLSWN